MDHKVKVLFIAGTGRNGSTLIGNILGQIDGFTNVGELIDLDRNLRPARPPCGCGVPLSDCEMWQSVLKEAFGEHLNPSFVECMYQLRSVESIPKNLAQLATVQGTQKLNLRLGTTLKLIEQLFHAIRKVCGSTTIVDSSKQPMYLHMLRSIDSIDLHVVHLVRDPRALAYAYRNRVSREGYVLQMKPPQSAVKWLRRNLAIELLTKPLTRRPLSVRYEDFAANPRETILDIMAYSGMSGSTLPFSDKHAVRLRPLHTVAGNPNRFVSGTVEIRERDEEWVIHMKGYDRAMVTGITLPWLPKYRYGCWPGKRRRVTRSLKPVLADPTGSIPDPE